MKQKIMEALLNSDSDISKEEIMWVASHLPNSSEKGEHKTVIGSSLIYNHSESNIYKALGLDESEGERTADLLAKITKKCAFEDHYKMSNAIEEIMEKSQDIPGFFPLIVIKILKDTLERLETKHFGGSDGEKALMMLLKEMQKRSKKRDDDDDDDK